MFAEFGTVASAKVIMDNQTGRSRGFGFVEFDDAAQAQAAIAAMNGREVGGRAMQTYHQWMECTLYATFAGLPAISLPAGFHANGRWPCGIQLVGRPQGDAELLHAAQGYENLAGELMARRP